MSSSASSVNNASKWVRRMLVLLYLGFFAGLAFVWRSPSLSHYLSPAVLNQLGHDLLATPLGPLAVLGGYVVAVTLAVPVGVMITAAAFVFGPVWGIVYALSGMVCGAVVTYGIGRISGAYLLDRFGDERGRAWAHGFKDRSLLPIIFVRVFPVAPFLVLNVTAGALRVRFRDYVLGTFLGLAPGTVLISLFADRLVDAWRHPGPKAYAALAGLALVLLLAAWFLRKRLKAAMRLARVV